MSNQTSTPEELFLKFFKFVILTVMSLTLICVVVALIFSVYQYSQSPKVPAPAQKAPIKTVDINEFLKQLKPDVPKQEEASKDQEKKVESPPKTLDIKYKEEAKKIIECDVESHKQAKLVEDEVGKDKIEIFRKQLQRIADDKTVDRGLPFVADLAKVSCAIYLHSQVIEYRKANTEADIFTDAINFHIQAWDALKEAEAKFNQDEQDRVKTEEQEEDIRVAMSKEAAKISLLVAAGAFGLFMALALYLIISAIESNLRKINLSIVKSNQGKVSEAAAESA
jgi:hypothetical protein